MYSRDQHYKFLMRMGVHPLQIKAKKNMSKDKWVYDISTEENIPLSNCIPANGTKSVCIKKAEFSNKNYTIAPAYSKGAYQVISKEDVRTAGKKV